MKVSAATDTAFKEDVITGELLEVNHTFNLIVWNDEINTFEWVIETLVEICGHTHEQAEQCAYIIHFHGKYAVKQGGYETLKPMREAITERGINATIEEIVQS
jgi:ATP-dependent Clp protease adaptor protein ClpS